MTLKTRLDPTKATIATVSISGTPREELDAIAKAGFDRVEIFEQDFIAHDGSPVEGSPTVRDFEDLSGQGDSGGQIFRLYSWPFSGGMFFEIVQRKGSCAGYGAPNAPLRIAAPKRLMRGKGQPKAWHL